MVLDCMGSGEGIQSKWRVETYLQVFVEFKYTIVLKLSNRVVEKSLFLFQSAAILEVLHCVLGLVRSGVIITLLQGIGLLNYWFTGRLSLIIFLLLKII